MLSAQIMQVIIRQVVQTPRAHCGSLRGAAVFIKGRGSGGSLDRDRGEIRRLRRGAQIYRLAPLRLHSVLPNRVRCALPVLRCFASSSHRLPSDPRGPAQIQMLARWAQFRSTIPIATKSNARRPLSVTHLLLTHSFTHAISGHLEGLTLMSRGHPGHPRVGWLSRFGAF